MDKMTDITERLRRLYRDSGTNHVQEAVDLIEALRQQCAKLEAKYLELEASEKEWIERGNYWTDEAAKLNEKLVALKAGNCEPVAWMTEDGMRVATSITKDTAMANPSKAVFCIPLYTSVQAIPEGWQLVPVESTISMSKAGIDAYHLETGAGIIDAYKAMLSAAPKGPADA